MTQAGREHTTQCIRLVHADALRIAPRNALLHGYEAKASTSCPKPEVIKPAYISSLKSPTEPHPELPGGSTTLAVRYTLEVANFCAAMDTLIEQDD